METTVNLYSKELDENRPHTLEHANALFARKSVKHDWELKDKEFKFDKNGIIVRRSSGSNNETD